MKLKLPYKQMYLRIQDQVISVSQVIEILKPFLTEERFLQLDKISKQRTYNFVPFLDGVYDQGNVSAVMRTAEAFDFVNFHIFYRKEEKLKITKRASQGGDRWLHIERHRNCHQALLLLKHRGYRLVGAHLCEEAVNIKDFTWNFPSVLILGNEKEGVSEEALKMCDEKVKIPTTGFSQSLNLSVAAGIFFEDIKQKMDIPSEKSLDSIENQQSLLASYLISSVDASVEILKRFLN